MQSKVFNSRYLMVTSFIPDKYFDWVIADIPYGINVANMPFLKERKTTVLQRNGTRINPHKGKKPYTLKDWDRTPPGQDYFDEVKRVSRNQIIFGINHVKWTGVGPGRIKWDKGVSEKMSFNRYEYAYCSLIDYEVEIALLWSGMMQAKSLAEPMVQQGNKKLNEKRIHPCHKPVMLYDAIFRKFAIVGMKVLDTHLGGGSIRITAEKFGCDFIGTEIDPEYYDDHQTRWQNYKSNFKIPFSLCPTNTP